jgi:hypothetical protein
LGNAHNCLQVAVTGGELWITPTFPFNLIAPYGFMGLERRTPTTMVTRAELQRGWLGASILLDIQEPEKAKPSTVELRLKAPEAFLSALRV